MEVKGGSQEVGVRYVHQERKGEGIFLFCKNVFPAVVTRRGQMPETTNRTTEGRGIAGIEDGP